MHNDFAHRMTRRGAALAVTAFAGTAALAAIVSRHASREDEAGSPSVGWADEPRSVEDMARMVGYFPNVALTTHDGVRVRFYDDLVRDKAVVVSLMYTGCGGVCPLAIANLVRAKEALGEPAGRDVFFYGLTLDPVIDTPEVLRAYAESVGAGRGFTFLTGAGADIDLVRRRLGLINPNPRFAADRKRHGAVAALGNEPLGRWCHVLALAQPERLLRTLRLILPPAAPMQRSA